MGLLSRAARSVLRRSSKAADVMDALAAYTLITGGVGGLSGMMMSAGDVESRGGNQDDINEAAYHGGRTGAMLAPLTFGPAVAMTAGLGPVGATPIIPWALQTGSEGSRRFDERQRRRAEEEAAMRAIELQMRGLHR